MNGFLGIKKGLIAPLDRAAHSEVEDLTIAVSECSEELHRWQAALLEVAKQVGFSQYSCDTNTPEEIAIAILSNLSPLEKDKRQETAKEISAGYYKAEAKAWKQIVDLFCDELGISVCEERPELEQHDFLLSGYRQDWTSQSIAQLEVLVRDLIRQVVQIPGNTTIESYAVRLHEKQNLSDKTFALRSEIEKHLKSKGEDWNNAAIAAATSTVIDVLQQLIDSPETINPASWKAELVSDLSAADKDFLPRRTKTLAEILND